MWRKEEGNPLRNGNHESNYEYARVFKDADNDRVFSEDTYY